MTTIVYRDGYIAADTGVHAHAFFESDCFHKIGRIKDGRLWGMAGDLNALPPFLSWARKGARLDNGFKLPSGCDAEAILVAAHRSREGVRATWIGGGHEGHCELVDPYFAIGSGKALAFGALDYGATALEALEIAIKRDVHSRGPVVLWRYDWTAPQVWIETPKGLKRKDDLYPGPPFETPKPESRIEKLVRHDMEGAGW